MDHEVEAVPNPSQLREGGIDGGLVRDIAIDHRRRIERLDQRQDAFLEQIALIGKCQFARPRRAATCAMPQAMECSLATPMIRPFLPFIRPSNAMQKLPAPVGIDSNELDRIRQPVRVLSLSGGREAHFIRARGSKLDCQPSTKFFSAASGRSGRATTSRT